MSKRNTLYFEGAGWENTYIGEIPNCRIRTAFTNNEGKKIYLEIDGNEKSIEDKKKYKRYENYEGSDAIGFIDFCYYITDNPKINDCNASYLPYERKSNISYSYDGILKFVNKQCNCSFDKIVILGDLSGYSVFSDCKHNTFAAYNYGDEFINDEQLTKIRKEIKKHFSDLEKSEGKQYPDFSIWVDDKEKHLLHLLRHFNGYNKHWSIRTDCENWKETIQETKLGRYAC